jgi:hypothetical protein
MPKHNLEAKEVSSAIFSKEWRKNKGTGVKLFSGNCQQAINSGTFWGLEEEANLLAGVAWI